VTPEQHNKYLAWAHVAHGGMILMFMLLFLGMFGMVFFAASNQSAQSGPPPPPMAFFVIIWLLMCAFYAAFTIPSFVAAYALFKRKRWAKIACIIAGAVGGMFFPTGTAVCVYTFWFLFSEPGKILYDNPAPAPQQASLFALRGDPVNQHDFQRDSSAPPPDWR
jgi:hypothetical protein